MLSLLFIASILKADMKYGKKHFTVDENRRDTYKQFHPSASSNGQSCLSNAPVDMRRFIPVCVSRILCFSILFSF